MSNCLFGSIEQLDCPFQMSGELDFSLWADWILSCSLWADWMSNCLFGSIGRLDCPFQMSRELSFSLWVDWVLSCFLQAGWTVTRLVLRLSLDSTCKVRVAGVQGVLLMMFLSYKGMSSHMTLRVLMVLMRWAPWAVTWHWECSWCSWGEHPERSHGT